MARVELPDGRCVAVSLPEEQLADLRRSGRRQMTVSGLVYGDPSASSEIASLTVEGRRIGLGLCGNFFVYVRD